MSKNYTDVKRAAEAALRGLCRTIISNLDEKDAEKLLIELSMSLFTASIDFEMPFDKFAAELSHKQAQYTLHVLDAAVSYKKAIDAGEDYEAEDL